MIITKKQFEKIKKEIFGKDIYSIIIFEEKPKEDHSFVVGDLVFKANKREERIMVV